jgi:hypothetical protein
MSVSQPQQIHTVVGFVPYMLVHYLLQSQVPKTAVGLQGSCKTVVRVTSSLALTWLLGFQLHAVSMAVVDACTVWCGCGVHQCHMFLWNYGVHGMLLAAVVLAAPLLALAVLLVAVASQMQHDLKQALLCMWLGCCNHACRVDARLLSWA